MNQLPNSANNYARRPNQDGTIDSICNHCFLTIARAFNPSHLKELELRHVCQQMERRQTVRIVYRIYDPSKGPSAA